ncbi:MAG: hypothetical protein IKK89_00960 [Alistipes sp.]|nr:hypothetical protein [Alistipes sp.]
MIQDIKYNGYSASPSDYECQDGDLAGAIGLVPDNGAMKPILPPSVIMQCEENERVVFTHTSYTFSHWIIYNDTNSKCYYIDSTGNNKKEIGTIPYILKHFNAIGNTLIAFTSDGMYYYLWRDGAYKSLGNHIPEVSVSFGLVGHPRLYSLSDESKSRFTISFSISDDALHNEFSESNKTTVTEQIMAKVNKFVAQETVNKGRFCFPFLVRYALRLYDGSLVYHSAPILMNPSTKAAPIVLWHKASGRKDTYTSAECNIMLVAANLDYNLIYNDDFYNIEEWSDIIKGIEVYISKPIYTYDQNGKISRLSDTDNFTTKFIGRLYADNRDTVNSSPAEDKLLGNFSSKEFLDYYCEWSYMRIYAMYYSSDRSYPTETFNLPEFTEGKVAESIKNTSTFYKLCSIELSEALANHGTRKEIIIDNEYLQSLVTREVMTDDYLSHDQLYASQSFVYNSRINLSGLKRKPFNGFVAQTMFAYCNSLYNWGADGTTLKISIAPFTTDDYSIAVYIKENEKTILVQAEPSLYSGDRIQVFNSIEFTSTDSSGNTSTHKNKISWGCYVFYPNPNAYKMVIYNYYQPCYVIDLKPHEFLNGAFALLDYELEREKNFTSLPTIEEEFAPIIGNPETRKFSIPVPTKIYTSEVNNPFYFPLLGINTIGTGDILGISTAAKALSEGQFGQFPLYAFTTDGVWALEVSNTGSYSARQPITRDVCINADSITQIDSAVLFATDRGIMLLQGSESICISDILDSKEGFAITDLPWGEQLVGKSGLAKTDFNIVPFREFLAGCRMLYDYTHQHIIVYNPNHTYAYVYSLESKAWGMTHSDIASGVNSYPEALAMTHAGELVDFSHSDVTQGLKGVLVTRPFKLGAPDLHKTIDTIIQRGHFRKGHIKVALYGSRNLYDWFLISSSIDHYLRGFRGTPYKYFRLALLCELDHDESVYGCTIQYTPRLINQPR